MALIVLDASVLVAHLDSGDVHHRAVEEALEARSGDDLRLPASAYAEALVGPLRRGRLEEARARINELLLQVEPIGEQIALAAARIRSDRPAIRLPDALVLACGLQLQAHEILIADARWQSFERVVVLS